MTFSDSAQQAGFPSASPATLPPYVTLLRAASRGYGLNQAATKWAWKQRQSGINLLTLLALAKHCNKHFECYPSIACLSFETQVDRRTIVRCLGHLKKSGIILDTGKRQGRTKQIIVYRLRKGPIIDPLKGCQKCTLSKPERVTNLTLLKTDKSLHLSESERVTHSHTEDSNTNTGGAAIPKPRKKRTLPRMGVGGRIA